MSPKQPHHADHADSVSYEDIEDPLTLGFDHLD